MPVVKPGLKNAPPDARTVCFCGPGCRPAAPRGSTKVPGSWDEAMEPVTVPSPAWTVGAQASSVCGTLLVAGRMPFLRRNPAVFP